MPDTIAFIETYSHPSRDSMEQMLRSTFPEYRLEVIPLLKLIKQHKGWILPNVWTTLREFPRDLLRGPGALRTNYLRTTYLMRQIRLAMREKIDPRRHVFSFQPQSMYDTSVEGVPHFIYTDHTHLSNLSSPYFDRATLRSAQWIALERALYEHASLVFTRSSDVTRDLVERYDMPEQHVACVRFGTNAVQSEHFVPVNDGYANKKILFVGHDWERKGGPELVEAFREVLKTHPTAQLIIAGANPTLDAPNCTVLGNQPIDTLTRLYAEASIFCVPTRLEPFGVVFLEAMQHRLPVVATRISAIPDMVLEGITGRLVEPGDATSLAVALNDLLASPQLCRSYGEAGYAHVAANYSWEVVGTRVRARILPFLGR